MRDQLSIRIKQGDEQAFELLFRLYFVHLSLYADKFLNDPEQAKEISQEVFCKIWEGDEIDPEYSLKYIFSGSQGIFA
jgi:RNA polymerase sigma-70 factor (ECF subfamily)